MDDQTTATQANNYDISADGAANAGYEEEPITPMPEEPSQPESEEALAEDGVRLREDGNLEFGDEFFADMAESAEEEPKSPNYYTDEELSQIPFQQWDLSRLNGDVPVSKIAPIVQSQLQQAQTQARSQAWENLPLPGGITEPKAYTPKELSAETLKLACEKLGIEDTEDFDIYELEHKSAYELASQELIQKRNAEISRYQATLQSWRDNARYQTELTRRPDFGAFNQWYLSECQKAGYTPQQVDDALYQVVLQNGNNFGVIKQVIEGWYQTFHQQTGTPKPKRANPPRMRRIPNPPILESTRGNNYAGRPSIKARDFAGMTDDEQAAALMNMGVV